MDIKKNLKVVLVVPNFKWCEWNKNTLWHYIPYNFCLLASMVIDKCDVKILDANLWTCDRSGKQYISFYPTDSMHGYVRTLDMPITTYRVIEEKADE